MPQYFIGYPISKLVREARKANRQFLIELRFGKHERAADEIARRDACMAQARKCRANLIAATAK